MFITAVARPQISTNGEVLWDGKIGIFHSQTLIIQ